MVEGTTGQASQRSQAGCPLPSSGAMALIPKSDSPIFWELTLFPFLAIPCFKPFKG